MKAAKLTEHPSFRLMRQTDVQNVWHMQMPRWLFSDPRYADRIVPMHPTLTAYLSDYRSKLPGDTEWLFPSSRGHYSRSTVYENFREMPILCKIPHTGKGPRVHDFRHTFCVHTKT